MQTHAEGSHQCHLCGKKFMRDSFLIRHQNRAHVRKDGARVAKSTEGDTDAVSVHDDVG